MENLKITIVGAGRVGTTIAYSISSSEDPKTQLKCVVSRTKKSLDRAKSIIGKKDIIYKTETSNILSHSNCILITTPDDLIKEICEKIFTKRQKQEDVFVINFSGSKSLNVLEAAKQKGANIGCLHPIKSFASIKEAISTLKGTVFGITYSSQKMKEVLAFMVDLFGGSFIEVENNKKPLYHASACIASNYLVTLLNFAVEVNKKIGIKPDDSVKALMGLIEGTIENVKKMGTKKSLTGPIARGDTGTIKEHLENFNKYFKEGSKTYKFMGKETAVIAYQNGWIDKKTFEKLTKLLEGKV
ncbi:MAG: Rossmann-like and DUF2520 domain-containing protein [Atribacterota bacterium]